MLNKKKKKKVNCILFFVKIKIKIYKFTYLSIISFINLEG